MNFSAGNAFGPFGPVQRSPFVKPGAPKAPAASNPTKRPAGNPFSNTGSKNPFAFAKDKVNLSGETKAPSGVNRLLGGLANSFGS